MESMRHAMEAATGTVLAVGTASWLEGVGQPPESENAEGERTWAGEDKSQRADRPMNVYGPVSAVEEQPPELESLEAVDCVLTDDVETVSAASATLEDVPVVVGPPADRSTLLDRGRSGDDPLAAHLEAALDAGANDVVDVTTADHPELLRRRLAAVLERQRATTAAAEANTWCRTLIEKSQSLFLVLDDGGRVTFAGPSTPHVVGADPNVLVDQALDERIHYDDRDSFYRAFEAVREADAGASKTCEYRYRHADETWRVHEAILTNRLEDPAVDGIVVSARDITDYRRIERELNESFDRVTDAFFSLDTDGEFTYLNDRAEELLETSKEAILGRSFVDVFPEAEGGDFQREAIAALESQEARTIESYYEPFDRWIEARMYPSPTGLSIYFRDVSRRVRREQALVERSERLQVLVENVPVVLFVIDDDGTFTLSEGRGLERIGVEPGSVVGQSIYDVYAEYPSVIGDVNRALGGESVHSFQRINGRIFETWYRPVVTGGTVERIIGIGVDVTERRQYDETINTLYEATQHLLTVESKQTACEYIVDVATDVLNLENVVVFRFDDRENELVPAAYTTDLLTDIGSPPRFGPNDSIVWQTFVEGESNVFDDVRASTHVYDEETAVRSGLFVPLGEHGVLATLSTEEGQFTEETADLAQVFGATAEAALDRISRTQRLHEREQELKRQNEYLERLNEASSLREEIESLLLRAGSRDEIEAGLCDRLTDLEDCSYAWIGEPDPGGNEILVRHEAGYGHGYLESVTVTAVDDPAAEPAGRTARTLEPTNVDNVAQDLRHGAWRTEALSRDFQSVYAVALVYDDFLYGVLTLYSTDRTGFDEPTRSVLDDFGETVAYAINAVQRKQALLGGATTEVELEVTSETPLAVLSRVANARVELEGIIQQDDGTSTVFASVDSDVEPDVLDSIETVTDGTIISRTDDRTVVQLELTEPFLAAIVDGHGGLLRSFTTHPETGTRTTLEIPNAVAVREVLAEMNRRGLSASMVARRERSGENDRLAGDPRTRERDRFLSLLTDRQREVVQTAYHGGFFEWPRETTGEELAGSLGISPPAFHNHVRSAERKLFTAVFDHEWSGVN
ncbi:PAS domain-containing protein [Natronosalvus caseinilyticus]|uniref:PAS domain-containing protein n=1 Tax=Natronosalvus caseinilyticus TaxID=2953747 RepID=UPI0028A8C232|nr:GAF domain-containing protein [Natronosalvus caseinilyticus]